MENKLIALKLRADKCPIKRFKAFIGKANTQATLCADTGIEIIGWSGFDASDLTAKSHRVELARFIAAADPETILSLLSELEAKDKRIAELEAEITNIVDSHAETVAELRAKLATPVRLPVDLEPNTEPCVICGVVSSHPEGWHYCHPKCGKEDA
ncbi:TPA: ead/Ea22-like family protein [Serratia marcescens]|uniref:ead/Ea22-like family protein n=1 Tax=Serratia marcescens TaxID=615 RepID=UPI000D02FF22|nr:ead/Ea22-like family protein [Serratia marcescens]AVN50243.1 hypothetical protein AM478_11115 [Serratia marcescens]MBH2835580.1 ead/Ea22-like family protein [Serratia marcescens]HEJ7093096.1 ead/Ea22-like family protein [Serratia marcescens]